MASATLYSQAGEQNGSVNLPDSVFDADVRTHALYETVKSYLANQRQGTHKTKNRHEVAGQRTKMYRQKGTGRARAGSSTSGIRVGGGRIHGPRPRDYRVDLPRKVRRVALRSALTDAVRQNEVHVIESFEFDEPSTRAMAAMLAEMGVTGKVLLVNDTADINVHKSCRNIPGVRVRPAHELHAYEVLWADAIVVSKPALSMLEEVYGE